MSQDKASSLVDVNVTIAEAASGKTLESSRAKSRLGFLAGKISVPDQFDRTGDDEIVNLFEACEIGTISPHQQD